MFALSGCSLNGSSDVNNPQEKDATFIVVDYKGAPLTCVVVGVGGNRTMSCDFIEYYDR